jgi:hypothetical protein
LLGSRFRSDSKQSDGSARIQSVMTWSRWKLIDGCWWDPKKDSYALVMKCYLNMHDSPGQWYVALIVVTKTQVKLEDSLGRFFKRFEPLETELLQ